MFLRQVHIPSWCCKYPVSWQILNWRDAHKNTFYCSLPKNTVPSCFGKLFCLFLMSKNIFMTSFWGVTSQYELKAETDRQAVDVEIYWRDRADKLKQDPNALKASDACILKYTCCTLWSVSNWPFKTIVVRCQCVWALGVFSYASGSVRLYLGALS